MGGLMTVFLFPQKIGIIVNVFKKQKNSYERIISAKDDDISNLKDTVTNLRKQQDRQLLNLTAEYGLIEACEESDMAAVWKGIERNSTTLQGNGLLFLGGGKVLHQPASLLSSSALKHCMQLLREEVDYIIIDSPPCGMFQDTAILAEYADSVLYLVGYDRLSANAVRDGIHALGGQPAAFLGYVFNACSGSRGNYGYGYGYGKYGYGRYGNYGQGSRVLNEGNEGKR